MELIKKQIHMNQFKGTVTTQITLDDDFIVPDTMDDMAQVMLDTGEIQIESVKNQGVKVAVKGKLEFQVAPHPARDLMTHYVDVNPAQL